MEELICMILLAYPVKWPACEFNHCPPPSAELKSGRSYAFTSPVWLYDVDSENFTFIFCYETINSEQRESAWSIKAWLKSKYVSRISGRFFTPEMLGIAATFICEEAL
jgi:hypothetical protein